MRFSLRWSRPGHLSNRSLGRRGIWRRAGGWRRARSARARRRRGFGPAHSSVGAALRRLHERAAVCVSQGLPFVGLALVPDDPDASWQPLTRHMSAVGRIGLASPVLEQANPPLHHASARTAVYTCNPCTSSAHTARSHPHSSPLDQVQLSMLAFRGTERMEQVSHLFDVRPRPGRSQRCASTRARPA